ncbi:MAG: hypothetical protein NVSMB57_15070 [Actinomycetota bacterium]
MKQAFLVLFAALFIWAGFHPGVSCASESPQAQPAFESEFVKAINKERSAAGLQILTFAADLQQVARAHSMLMAQKDSIFHNPKLRTEVSQWMDIGENVGVGDSVEGIHLDFMNSPSHRANVLYASDNRVGVGAVWINGQLFVTEVFARRSEGDALPPADRSVSSAWMSLASAHPASSDGSVQSNGVANLSAARLSTVASEKGSSAPHPVVPAASAC